MQADYQFFLRNSNRNWVWIGMGGLCLILLLFWTVMLRPQSVQASLLASQIGQLQQQISAANDRIRNFEPPKQTELLARSEMESQLRECLPPVSRIPELVQALVQLAQKNGLNEIVASTGSLVVPSIVVPGGPPTPRVAGKSGPSELERLLASSGVTDVVAVPIEISFRGDHAQFGRFLLGLQEMKQFFDLDKLTVRRAVPKAEAKVALRLFCQAPVVRDVQQVRPASPALPPSPQPVSIPANAHE